MVGYNGNRWTAAQLKLLEEMRAMGVKWPAVIDAIGHPLSSCIQMLSKIRGTRRNEEFERARAVARAARRGPAVVIPKKPPPLKVLVPDAPYVRATSTAKLVMDAELRSRIEVQGITGGLLGDPMPGRSALDRKRAGIVDAPATTFGRPREFSAPVTLATGPLR